MLSPDTVEERFDFIRGEVLRVAKKVAEGGFKDLTREDICNTIRDHAGHERLFSLDGSEALRALAAEALKESSLHRRVDPETAYSAVKAGFGREYLNPDFVACTAQDDLDRLRFWVEQTGDECSDRTHFIPCHIGLPDDVTVKIGPVAFRRRAAVLAELMPKFEAQRATQNGDQSTTGKCPTVDGALDYLGAFSDIATVTIERCGPKASRVAADEAVAAALAYLHIAAGGGYTRRMRGGGPALRGDRRATVAITHDGELSLTWSVAWEGANTSDRFWHELTVDFAEITDAAGEAVRIVTERLEPEMLAARYLDAAAWYADAVREPRAPAAVVKYLTAMERLLWTGEKGPGVTKRLSERAAALSFDPTVWNYEELKAEIKQAYELRSGIVHGRLSDRDPELIKSFRTCEKVARDLLLVWLKRYGDGFRRAVLMSNAKDHFDGFVAEVEEETAKRKTILRQSSSST